LNWSAQPHPLDDLEKLLVDLREESLDEIVTNITSIIEHLKSDESKPAADTEEPGMRKLNCWEEKLGLSG